MKNVAYVQRRVEDGGASQNRAAERTRIARGPAAGFNLMKKIVEKLIEKRGLLKIDGVAGARQDDQRRSWDRALEHQRGLEAGLVLVAGHQQDRQASFA